ncbi:CRISPR-associated helicase Cas3' [Lactiplantibacillus modestisalitolerans]|uniref:CRISPR-associated helicase Cas3 n=2 Tax=Lactiplantibacillus modestisalitolerans TaxID=1457219 RepID=A0ABV5WRH4_9LACO|nr:CRISPR-associated helicase Cas3' [Lactiplantibacillus modestisalitolerans]
MQTTALVNALWAKKTSGEEGKFWLPLIVHLTDTANVINWLYTGWVGEGVKLRLEESLSPAGAQKLIKFIGFVHDIGKATPAFQAKRSRNHDDDLDSTLMAQLTVAGFKELKAPVFMSESPHPIAGETILDWHEVPDSVASIIGAHHGRTIDASPETSQAPFQENYYQSTKCAEVQRPWKIVQEALFNQALEVAGYQSVAEIPTITQPQAVILEGLLIMADWLASTEYLDSAKRKPLFPLVRLGEPAELDTDARLQSAILNWKTTDSWHPAQVALDEDPYHARWGFHAREFQQSMTTSIGQATDPGLIIIEAGMGSGKTEVALVAAEQLAHATGRNGVFMGLPTQATTDAMFTRFNQWLSKIAVDERLRLQEDELHGKKVYNPLYQELVQSSNVNAFDEEDNPRDHDWVDGGSVALNSWFTGKKSVLTPFSVGTIDNLLLMGLKQKHLFLRHFGFSGKVVIIDEVHAYDTYMTSYLEEALIWLGAYHVPVVILSATLPKEKRNELIKKYLRGKYGYDYRDQLVAPANWQEVTAYPLLSLVDGCELKQVTDNTGNGGQLTQTVAVQRFSGDDQALVQNVLDRIKLGGVAGIIVNTVKRAQGLAELVAQVSDIQLMVLHSAFLAPDRVVQEAELQRLIGKHGQRPERLIVIGTQVLEQSLDVDFDIMYTDIAPIDLVLQRVGRLHRHVLKRPVGLEQPQLVLLGVNGAGDYGDANEAVYGNYLLRKTDYFLPDTLTLPTAISPLVQKVYDQRTDQQVPGIKAPYREFKRRQNEQEDRAEAFQIQAPQTGRYATLHGWLKRAHQSAEADSIRANAAVRDIQESLEVVLLRQSNTGVIQLLDGRPVAAVRAMEVAQQVIRIPAAITRYPKNAIDRAIKALERQTAQTFPDWAGKPWLRGSLALVLDESNTVTLLGWQLSYSTTRGLSYQKEE